MKYSCKICKYDTDESSNYNRHCKSKLHLKKEADAVVSDYDKVNKLIVTSRHLSTDDDTVCKFCKKELSSKRHLLRHHKTCKSRKKYVETHTIENVEKDNQMLIDCYNKLMNEHKALKDMYNLQLMLIKSQEDRLTDQKQITQQNTSNSHNSTHNTNSNNTNNINLTINANYIHKNFNNTQEYSKIMEPDITAEEAKMISAIDPNSSNPAAAIVKLIHERCIKDRTSHEYPFYCTDAARNNYLVRTDNSWENSTLDDIMKTPIHKVSTLYGDKLTEMRHDDSISSDCYTVIGTGLTDMHKNSGRILKKTFNGSVGNDVLCSSIKQRSSTTDTTVTTAITKPHPKSKRPYNPDDSITEDSD